jgi:hypothetical protein
MEFSSNAPKIIPLFPFNKLCDILFNFYEYSVYQIILLLPEKQQGRDFPPQHLGNFHYPVTFSTLLQKSCLVWLSIFYIPQNAFSPCCYLWKMGYRNNLHIFEIRSRIYPILNPISPDTPLSISSNIMVGKQIFQ